MLTSVSYVETRSHGEAIRHNRALRDMGPLLVETCKSVFDENTQALKKMSPCLGGMSDSCKENSL
jgi:hypothetical protein